MIFLYMVHPTSIFLSFSSSHSLYLEKKRIIFKLLFAIQINYLFSLSSDDDFISMWIDCSGDIGSSIT